MPGPLDFAFAILSAVVLVAIATTWFDARLKRRIAAGVATARRDWYRGTLIGEWVVGAAAVVLWWREGRPWRVLGLVPPADWRLYAGALIAIVLSVMLLRQNSNIRRLPPDGLQRLRSKLAGVEAIIPHSRREYRWFLALSWTAGVCEELLYRGFLTWLIAAFVGTAAGVLLAALAFGLGHAYQGRAGIVKTGLVGLVLGCIVLLSGWLVPAMIVHALIDVSSAVVGYAVLGDAAVDAAVAA